VRLRWVDDDGLYRPYDSDDQGRSVLGRPKDTKYWADVWSGPYSVVYGHAVHSLVDPRITVNDGVITVGLDTGCCFGGRLTALLLPSFDFVQVQARRTYWSMPDVAWAE
jgi:serine/threonine protein phosphatase 1